MKTKRITTLLMALTLAAALSACGNKTKSNTPTNDKVKAASIDEKPDDATASAITAMDEATEEAIDVAAQPEGEPGATAASDEAESDKADSTTTSKAKTKSSESNTAKSNSSTYNAPAANTTAHQHNWKDHTATEQVWVSNMVTVDDYEDKVTRRPFTMCDCGAKFYYDSNGNNGYYDHVMSYQEPALAKYYSTGDDTELNQAVWQHGGSVEGSDLETEKVKVGSHQEDQGHYETRTYVDYRYCDCGARQ